MRLGKSGSFPCFVYPNSSFGGIISIVCVCGARHSPKQVSTETGQAGGRPGVRDQKAISMIVDLGTLLPALWTVIKKRSLP